mgnify:CR=1 FL=1
MINKLISKKEETPANIDPFFSKIKSEIERKQERTDYLWGVARKSFMGVGFINHLKKQQ